MISIICVFNDKRTLQANLLYSLKIAPSDYELILIDNSQNAYSSLTTAMNFGALKAKGEFLMFVHQDVEFPHSNWIDVLEPQIKSISNLGIAGPFGVDSMGGYAGFIIDRGSIWGIQLNAPKQVMTLDESLVIIPRAVFRQLKFDERFAWHSWAADYCLAVRESGLNAYAIPLIIRHNSPTAPILEIGSLKKDDLLLLSKHNKKFGTIFKTTGTVAVRHKGTKLKTILLKLHNNMMKTIFNFNANTMLDIISLREQISIKDEKGNTYSVGVSEHLSHILASQRINTHDDYVLADFRNLPFKEQSFDLIILKSVLEFMPKHKGRSLISSLSNLSKTEYIYVCNNGYSRGGPYDNFVSIWNFDDLRQAGYTVYGIGLIIKNRFLENIFALTVITRFWALPRASIGLIGIKRNKKLPMHRKVL